MLTRQKCVQFFFSREQIFFYLRLEFSTQIKRRASINTSSCANALPESSFNDLKLNASIITLEKPQFVSVPMAYDQRVSVDKQANISSRIGPQFFREIFQVLPKMNSVFVGNTFFKKHNYTID